MKTVFVIALVLVSAAMASLTENNEVKVLTDDNFEHDTQAATGMTTGDWFVLLYADFCPHCHRVKPEFKKLAEKYDVHATNIAWLNCEENPWTCQRFGVQWYPEMILLRRGKLYRYGRKSPRTVDGFTEFLTKAEDPEEPVAIPAPYSLLDKGLSYVTIDWNAVEIVYNEMPILIYGVVVMFVILVVMIIFTCYRVHQDRKLANAAAAGPAPAASASKKVKTAPTGGKSRKQE